MKTIPEIAVSLSTQQCSPIEWDDLNLAFGTNSNLVFIDWIIPKSFGKELNSPIYILVVRPTQKESIQRIKLDVTADELRAWRSEFEWQRKSGGRLSTCGDELWGGMTGLVEPLLRPGVT